jgi:cell wall-associated NlpC family hydrolase
MRRLAVCLTLLAILAAAPTASGASWAKPYIREAVHSGLMGPSVAGFRANDALTRRELGLIVVGITRRERVVSNPDRPVTMTELNRALVNALGLAPAATAFRAELSRSELKPPARAGWETVARLLQLRFNHPSTDDDLERRPADQATRAEAAYSVAQLLHLSEWDLERANDLAGEFHLPDYSDWQRRVLTRAVHFVGYPYVWGGMSEHRQTLFGVTSRGGFDCSGLVWRVYKLESWPDAPRLGTTIVGRTTYQMAGEMRRTARIGPVKLRAADIIFYGSNGRESKPSQITHTGISMGSRWFIHSSGQGTTIVPLDGWYSNTFAWARRALREAGLG